MSTVGENDRAFAIPDSPIGMVEDVVERSAGMKLRLGFGIALLVVLFGVWMLLSKPSCLVGYRASLASATNWRCVPD